MAYYTYYDTGNHYRDHHEPEPIYEYVVEEDPHQRHYGGAGGQPYYEYEYEDVGYDQQPVEYEYYDYDPRYGPPPGPQGQPMMMQGGYGPPGRREVREEQSESEIVTCPADKNRRSTCKQKKSRRTATSSTLTRTGPMQIPTSHTVDGIRSRRRASTIPAGR